MNKKQILQVSLAGIIGFVIYVAILLPLVRYIKKYRKRK